MPEIRKYPTNAQRQAAYRQRARRAREQQLAQRGLPRLPAIPTMPGEARWTRALQHAAMLVETIVYEMDEYYEERSEAWQESERGETFAERLSGAQELLSSLQEMSA